MPSDARMISALDALREPIDGFRSAVASALALVTDYLEAHRAPAVDHETVTAVALGSFAAGRLDVRRFADTFGGPRSLAQVDIARITRCRDVLASLLEAGDALFAIDVPGGADLGDAVAASFARIGGAFGALLAFQAIKSGTYRDDVHGAQLAGLPFERWNRAERLLAPPLLVSVDGPDLDAAPLARFVDGRVRIVLRVRGATAPAALVPLVSPGVYVAQIPDAAPLAALARCSGPAVVALVAADAAHFVHDPSAGTRLCDRLSVQQLPADPPHRAIGRHSASQQLEQVAQLRALAAAADAEMRQAAGAAMDATRAVAVAAAARGEADAVDVLAGWLLGQAGLAPAAAGEAAR